MANSGSGDKSGSGNRKPKGTGNRSTTTARRSGTPPSYQVTKKASESAPDEEVNGSSTSSKSADERARERLSQPATKRSQQGAPARGGKKPRSSSNSRNRKPQHSTGRTAGLIGGVVVVIAIVVILLVSTLGSPAKASPAIPYAPAPSYVVNGVTGVTPSQFATAGTGAGLVSAQGVFVKTPNQPPLSVTVDGKQKPTIVYIGAEFCPYCAAFRWPLTIALSRFGTFTGLGTVASSPTDVWANTHTLSFWKANYSSPYINFEPTEETTNVACKPVTATCQEYTPLETPSKANQLLYAEYDSCKYFPNPSDPTDCGGIPFVNWGGKYVSDGGLYLPSVINLGSVPNGPFHPFNWQQILAAIKLDPVNQVGQTIVGAANWYTAMICQLTGQQPGSVCSLPAVKNSWLMLQSQAKTVS